MKATDNANKQEAIPEASDSPNRGVRVLVVDDDPVVQALLEAELETLGYQVSLASNGMEALDIMRKDISDLDVILLDRQMPEMDGLEVVAHMKSDAALKNIPIIMQTSSDQPDQIKQGIDAGVFYYLTKPVDMKLLSSIVATAVNESRQKKQLGVELKQHKMSFGLIEECKFSCRTLPEAESLSCFIANSFPEPDRVVSGLAELLINAIEHGNLGIDYEQKTWLVNDGVWRQEVMKRCLMPENSDKFVHVFLKRDPQGISVTIQDQGKGFDWKKYLKIDPARAQDNHGRGIAQSNAISFDKLSYNDVGNEVTAFVGYDSKIDW